MRHRNEAPARTPAEAAIDEILRYAGARPAFEKLRDEGMPSDLLQIRLLALRDYKRTRKHSLLINPKTCRVLSKKLAALLREIDDLHVNWWRRRRGPRPVSAEPEPAIANNLRGLLPIHFGGPPVPFDVSLLREQLRAGSRYFARVGMARKPIPYGVVKINAVDMQLRTLQDDVKKYTGSAHYKEIEVLCTAAAGGRGVITKDALKTRASRSRKD